MDRTKKINHYKKGTNNTIAFSICYVLISFCLYYLTNALHFNTRLSNTIYDNFSISHLRETAKDIIIIAIDDKSLSELKTWPWPRNYHASLIDYLTRTKAKAIALNIIFTETTENDALLAESFKENQRIILPIQPIRTSLRPNQETDLGKSNIFHKITALGHVAIDTDSDGRLRAISLYGGFGDKIYPNLALQVLNITNPSIAQKYSQEITQKEYDWQTSEPIHIQFSGPTDSIPSISYTDVLAGRIPAETFQDKIIFIGTKTSGLGDNFIPAISGHYQQMSGVEIQAQIFDALRLGKINSVFSPLFAKSIEIFFILSTAILLIFCSPLLGIGIGVGSTLIQIVTSYILFVFTNTWLPLAGSILVTIMITLLYSSFTAHLKLKEINRFLEAYVEERTQELRVANLSLEEQIKERKTIELILIDNELQQRIILDNIQVGVLMLDEYGIILAANKTASILFKKSNGLLNKNIDHCFFYDPTYGQIKFHAYPILQQLDTDEVNTHIELEINNGHMQIPVEVGFSRLTQQNKTRYICLIRDITLQKHSETLTQEFIATVSHELRTPLTSIKGSLSLITNIASLNISEKVRGLLNIALRNSDRLLMLVNDILDIQKIQLGTLNFQLRRIDLIDIITQSLEVNESYAEMQKIQFAFRKPNNAVFIMGDSDRLIQVMTNLLSNAVKFSPSGKIVDITLITSANEATISIIDYGDGIPNEFKPQIFQKFAQASQAKHHSKGTGLGLSITKALIDKMGGEINFYSEKGKGSIFYFTFPLSKNHCLSIFE